MSPQVPGPRRPDASMTLITSMLERPLDPGYAAAAERRQRAGLSEATTLRSPRLVVFLVLVGVLVGIAAVQLRGGETNRQRTKTASRAHRAGEGSSPPGRGRPLRARRSRRSTGTLGT